MEGVGTSPVAVASSASKAASGHAAGEWAMAATPLFCTGIYVGHLCAPYFSLLLALNSSFLKEVAEGRPQWPTVHLSWDTHE